MAESWHPPLITLCLREHKCAQEAGPWALSAPQSSETQRFSLAWSSPIATHVLQQPPSDSWYLSFSPGSGLPIRPSMLRTSPAIRLQEKAAPEAETEFLSCCSSPSPFGWFWGTFYVFKEIRVNQKTRFHSWQLTFLFFQNCPFKSHLNYSQARSFPRHTLELKGWGTVLPLQALFSHLHVNF